MRRWEQDIQDWLETTATQAGRKAEDLVVFRKKIWEAMSYKGSADWLIDCLKKCNISHPEKVNKHKKIQI